MVKRSAILQVCVLALLAATLACGKDEPAPGDTGPSPATEAPTESAPTEAPAQPTAPPDERTEAPASGRGDYDTVFPLPDDVQNFMGEGGEGSVNFQTSLSLEDVLAFYREAFGSQGLTERELLTVTTETTFSVVFDGSPNGKAIVVQGVDLGGSTNVNIRFEDV